MAVLPTSTVEHWHSCPRCYERVGCIEPCEIEPDLSEPDRLFGCYWPCYECAPFNWLEAAIDHQRWIEQQHRHRAMIRLGGPPQQPIPDMTIDPNYLRMREASYRMPDPLQPENPFLVLWRRDRAMRRLRGPA